MIQIRKTKLFKFMSWLLVALFIFQADLLLSIEKKSGKIADYEEQFKQAKKEFDEGKYKIAKIRLERLQSILNKKVKEEKRLLERVDKLHYKIREIVEKNVIEKEKKKKRRRRRTRFWLILGGVVVTGVLLYFFVFRSFTLTVDKGEGVEGSPNSGEHKKKKGKSINYNYTLMQGYTDLVVKLDGREVSPGGSVKMDKNHTLSASAARLYTLTVTKGAGVNGYPESGSYIYKRNDRVDYNYSLQSGYSNLVVKRNGEEIAHSGTINIERDYTLSASAAQNGKLRVTSSPRGADVWINDVLKANQTPVTFHDIGAGRYHVSVRTAGYGVKEENVDVYGGQQTDIHLSLKDISFGTRLMLNDEPKMGLAKGTRNPEWYWFYIKTPGTYTIETSPTGRGKDIRDNYMCLYGPDSLSKELECDDDDGEDSYAKITSNLVSPGNYFVKVTGNYSFYKGFFYIKVYAGQ